jgi:hypothetical protein
MAAIERFFPIVDHIPPSIREPLGRRLRELTGLGMIALSGAAAAEPQPRHLARDPQRSRLSRRDRR